MTPEEKVLTIKNLTAHADMIGTTLDELVENGRLTAHDQRLYNEATDGETKPKKNGKEKK